MDRHLTQYISKHLTSKQIATATRIHGLHFATRLTRNKTRFIHAIMDAGHTALLLEVIDDELRRRADLENQRRVRQRVDVEGDRSPADGSSFLEVPSEEELKAIYRRFYNATSNEALRIHTCAVCGRARTQNEEATNIVQLTDLPNKERLRPPPGWPGDVGSLVYGLLLVEKGCAVLEGQGESSVKVEVCVECFTDLSKEYTTDTEPLPPKYSLANGLWYGEVPWVLRCLTLPERLLIALIYPRAYIVKLFPKAGKYDPTTLQTAMMGNITSFDLNLDRIADMVEGRIMPQAPHILASLISITFVGVKRLPKDWLKSTFQVRRYQIRQALLWLKEHNPYYANIVITDDRLDMLPEGDVPDEIWSLIQEDPDTEILDKERDNYVPTGDMEQSIDGTSGKTFLHRVPKPIPLTV